MRIRQLHGLAHQSGRDLRGEYRPARCLRNRERSEEAAPRKRRAPAAGDGGGHFDGGDERNVNMRGWSAARDAAYPGRAGFPDIALDQALESTK